MHMILHCQLHSWLFNSTNHRQAAFTAQDCFVPPVLKAQGKRGKGMVQIKQPALFSLSTRSLHHSWFLFGCFHSNVMCYATRSISVEMPRTSTKTTGAVIIPQLERPYQLGLFSRFVFMLELKEQYSSRFALKVIAYSLSLCTSLFILVARARLVLHTAVCEER